MARLARKTLGASMTIVGVEASGPMLAVARGIDATVDWREGNATALPVAADEQFSIETCHQGLQCVPDQAGAVREMRRVLCAGGRASVGTRLSIEEMPLAATSTTSHDSSSDSFTDSRHSFGVGKALATLLAENGFYDANVETVSHDVRIPENGLLFARMNAMAVVGMSAKGRALDDAGRGHLASEIAAASLEVLNRYTKDGRLTFSLTTNVATARA